ncbi:MAG: hypothetical protein CMO55_10035 [Verrucomicrobiales bacterium]|nr:hypothetical protein [Verrucomicrobiales bacterium]
MALLSSRFDFRIGLLASLSMLAIQLPAIGEESGEEVFRPKPGKFPPLEKAHSYRGELVFVDHATRRGSLRVEGKNAFRRNEPQPFALLPYAIVRYHGAPADLRDIPLGTMLHVRAFLPPDPKISSVPVLPINNKEKKSGYGDPGTAPAENHVLLLEDEMSHCQREGLVWKLKELEIENYQGLIVARREPTEATTAPAQEETFSFDASTRIWRGRERLGISDLVDEGTWPENGKKPLDGQVVQLGITWRPTPGGVFTRFHISDIWLDDTAINRAAQLQAENHKAFIRSRWVPAWIDEVEYGKFGSATVTATLFGGIDDSLYADFTKDAKMLMNPVENTLKHTEGGSAGPTQMSAKGSILEVTKTEEPPLGSSGIQICFATDLITEGIRPPRIVRVRPANWPDVHLPREEYMRDGAASINERFPSPDFFPKY